MGKRKSTAGTRAGRSRRGRGKDFTGGTEGDVEVRSGEFRLDKVELNEKDVNTHIAAIKKAKENKDTYVALLRNAKKRADELAPGLAAEIEEQLRDERKNDPKAVAERLVLKGIVLKATGSPIQLTVFDTLAGDQEEQVEKRFFADGKAGRPFDCRYPESSDLFAIAREHWVRGQGELNGLSPEDAAKAAHEAVHGDDEGSADEEPAFDLSSPPNLPPEQVAPETAH